MASYERSTVWERAQPTPVVPPGLWSAARAGNAVELVRLLDLGYPINERDERGYAPLMLAAYAGQLDTVEALLARGADPNTSDLFGNTVLMGAVFKGHLAIVRQLLAAGADPARTNHGGLDARGMAMAYGRSDALVLLQQVISWVP